VNDQTHYSYAHGRLAGMAAGVGGSTQPVVTDLTYRRKFPST